jgi:hypothetical protein
LNGPFQGTAIQQQKVRDVIREWQRYCNVTFTWVAAQNATIRITFNPALGSWSYVGTDVSLIRVPDATMNLGWIDQGAALLDEDRGVILHEFGHTLGMQHEHQSPSRGGRLTLKEDGK